MTVIVRAQTEVIAPSGPLTAWHLCSLDAPTIAVVWMAFLARTHGVRLPVLELLALFLAVWLLYAGDRLLDGRGAEEKLEARHRFHRQHTGLFTAVMACAGVVLAVLLFRLPHIDLAFEAALAVLVLCYFAVVHLTRLALPKELFTAAIFALAVALPTLGRVGFECAMPAVLFALICVANGLYISAWECDRKASVPIFISVSVLIAAVVHPSVSFVAAGAAAAAMLLLNRWCRSFAPMTLRAAVDLALLTPLLFWFWRS